MTNNVREKFADVVAIKTPPREDAGCIHIPRLEGDITDISDLYVFVDGIQIGQYASMRKAWMVLASSYYVFNTEYPRNQRSSRNFTQRVLLNIKDSD